MDLAETMDMARGDVAEGKEAECVDVVITSYGTLASEFTTHSAGLLGSDPVGTLYDGQSRLSLPHVPY